MGRSAKGTRPKVIARSAGLHDVAWLIDRERCAAIFPWNINSLQQSIEAGHECQICNVQKQDIGYFVLLHGAGTSEILNLIVFEAMQNRGYGTEMLALILRRAVENSSDQVWLEVREGNDVARKLYSKAGFIVQGTRKNYYPFDSRNAHDQGKRENAVLMTLAL